MAFALKDNFHLRHTLILDPIATFFLFEFVIVNQKHFRIPVPSRRQMYGYAFKSGEPVDSFGEYHRFRRRKYKLKEEYKYYAFADIATCFNSFYHHDVSEAIESRIGLQQSQEFGQFLREINAGMSIDCFPQGLYPAKVIGNWFLSFIESSMKLKSSAIIRFLDDIYFFSNDKSCVYEDILILQHILGGHALSLNAEKTMFGLDLAVSLLLVLGFLQGNDLAFGEDQAILGDLGLQGLESPLEGLQIVSQPDASNAAGRDEEALLAEFIGETDLSPGRLVEGELDHRLFDLGGDPILDDGFTFGDFL